MLFNSLEFMALLALCVLAYWATPVLRVRQVVLLVGSVVFYASWLPIYLLLLAVIVLINWGAGLRGRENRALVVAAIVVDLAVLAYFKYAGFALENFTAAARAVGIALKPVEFSVILPLGISFWVFQAIAYVVDVRTGKLEPEKDLLTFFLFKLFFPQLIAGPICRGWELLPQLKTVHRFDAAALARGALLLAAGLLLKIGFADNISPFVNRVFDAPADATGWQALAGALCFGVVILGDFWGYSTMSLGAALCFGVKMPENFNLPYLATSLQEFWRRWHITLSNWLRDYLYIPLGGSRFGELATVRNLTIVMGLGGLWHGAAWTFVIWGLIHGVWLVVEREWRRVLDAVLGAERRLWRLALAPFGWAITMVVVFVAWVFFRAESASAAATLLSSAARAPEASNVLESLGEQGVRSVALAGVFLAVMVPIHLLVAHVRAASLGPAVRLVLAFWLALFAVVLSAGDVQEFIYFQF